MAIKHNFAVFFYFFFLFFFYLSESLYLCTALEAQMAESVDALVSNTSGATHPGSSPGLGTS